MLDQPSAARPQALDPSGAAFVETFAAFLVGRGVLDELADHRARRAQAQSGERFDLVLTRLGLVSEAEMARQLAEFLDLPLVSAADLPETPLLADRLQLQFLTSNRIIPVSESGETLRLALADPFNTDSAAAVGYLLGRPIEYGIMPAGEIERALERLYGRGGAIPVDAGLAEPGQASEDDVRRLEDMASEAPVIRLVHDLVTRAVEVRASDIHVEPWADSCASAIASTACSPRSRRCRCRCARP